MTNCSITIATPLENLGNETGLLGLIFNKSQNKFQDPAKLRRLIVDLIGSEKLVGDERRCQRRCLRRAFGKKRSGHQERCPGSISPHATDSGHRRRHRSNPGETISDPACGTGGFLLAAHDSLVDNHPHMTKDERKKLKDGTFKGWELVQSTARLCAMNLMLHGIGSDDSNLPLVVSDSLAADPGDRFDIILTNPPFGKKSSTTIVAEDGKVGKDKETVERDDFWATTSNKQLNFMQHVKTLLKQHGRAAVVVPDNVLFEGGAGETIRRKLLHECDVHTILRLPTGLFYAQGVKANVIFLTASLPAKPVDEKTMDLRPAHQHALHPQNNPLKRSDLDEFVQLYNPATVNNAR